MPRLIQVHQLKDLPGLFRGLGGWAFKTTAEADGLGNGWKRANGQVVGSYTTPNQAHGKYVKGGNTVTYVDAGAATHYHTYGSHAHSTGTPISGVECAGWNCGDDAGDNHYHDFSSVGAGNLTAGNNDPLYFGPVPLVYTNAPSATGIRQHQLHSSCFDIFDGAIAWTEEASWPAEWKLCDGTSGTPNLVGKFIRGVNSGANTTGGNADHQHSVGHHHGNTGWVSSSENGGWSDGCSGCPGVRYWHAHATTANNQTSSGVAGGGTVEPLNRTLRFLMYVAPATNGKIKPHQLDLSAYRIPAGLSFARNSDVVPSGWSNKNVGGRLLVHGSGNYGTGGNAQHSHGGDSHNHGQSGNPIKPSNRGYYRSTDSSQCCDSRSPGNHPHDHGNAQGWSINNVASEPPYHNLIFVERVA